jgi:ABC-type Fe3+/spermidine/putrescine transport system ATPase subunit
MTRLGSVTKLLADRARVPPSSSADRSNSARGVKGSVSLRSVTKRYGDFEAVSNLSLDVDAGEFLAILGPSGSGKTTTMRIIGGFVRPDEGTVSISGVDVRDQPPFRRDANTVFQNYALFPHMSVEDNVAYALRMKRVARAERRRRAAEMLALVRLSDAARRRPSELSGGMQQRVAVARALAANPSVLLLDEPLGALDRKLREEMQLELRRIQTTLGTTFIYVTHDQDEALGLADRLVVMREGRIEQSGPPAQVYDSPATLWVAGFVGSSNQFAGVVRAVGRQVEIEGDVTRLVADQAHDELRAGDRAVVAIRPEHVRVSAASGARDHVNRVGARIEDRITIGEQVRVLARTPGGIELVAQASRSSFAEQGRDLERGDDVDLVWESAFVHVYRAPRAEQSSHDGFAAVGTPPVRTGQ